MSSNQYSSQSYTSPARSTIKDRSSSTNKSSKLKQQKRQAMEEEIKDFDKLKIIAVNRLSLVFALNTNKFLNKALFRLVANRNTEINKRFGFVILEGIFKSKQRGCKMIALRAMREAVSDRNKVKKYCIRLRNVQKRLGQQKVRGAFMALLKNAGRKEEVIPLQTSKSTDKLREKTLQKASSLIRLNKLDMVAGENSGNSDGTEKMALSAEMRQVLQGLQRYDKEVFVSEVEKNLKRSTDHELKRLERIKKGNKEIPKNDYDNQLTLGVINNLMKGMNDLKNNAQMNEQKKTLEKKIIEINQQRNQEIKELRESYKLKESEWSNSNKILEGQVKEFQRVIDTVKGYFDNSYSLEKIRKGLQTEVKRFGKQPKPTTDLLTLLIQLTDNQGNDSNPAFNLQQINSQLSSILIDSSDSSLSFNNTSLDSALKLFQKQKRVFEAQLNSSQTDLKQYYQNLVTLTSQLHSLHYQLYLRSTEISQLNLKLESYSNNVNESKGKLLRKNEKIEKGREQGEPEEVEERLRETPRSCESLRDSRKNPLQQYVRQWADIVENMIECIKTGDKTWTKDINKKKKWINSHKNNQELIKLVNNDVNLMNIIAGNERDTFQYQSSPEKQKQERSGRREPKTEPRVEQAEREKAVLQEKVRSLEGSLKVHAALNWEIGEIDTILNNMNRFMLNQQKFQQESWINLRLSIKSLISRHPKTLLINILHSINHLVQLIESQIQSHDQLDEQFKQLADQIIALKSSSRAFSFLISKDLLSQQLIGKMRENLESVKKRIEASEKVDGEVSSVNSLYWMEIESKSKLLDIMESQVKGIKELREENLTILLKLKEVEGDNELSEKLNLQNLELVNMQESGRRLQELMKIESSIEDIVEDDREESNPSASLSTKIKTLQDQKSGLEQQLQKYQQLFQKYSLQQKLMLQRIQQSQQSISTSKSKLADSQYKVYDLQSKNRQLSYKYNLIYNEKIVIENIIQKESGEKEQILEQLQMKQRVIKELSRDITALDSKVQRLQENNQRLDKERKEVNERIIEVDAMNIDLLEKSNEFDQLKEEMTRMIRESTMKALREEGESVNELRLESQNQQYRIMIDQLSKRVQRLEEQVKESEEKRRVEEERSRGFKEDLDQIMEEREMSFKEYQSMREEAARLKEECEKRIVEKESEMRKSSEEMGRSIKAMEEYEGKVKEDQLKLSRDIQKIVSERLGSQELYYNNLLEVGKTSYEGVIKNQKSEIERLSKQITDASKSAVIIQELESETSRLRLEIISVSEYREEANKKCQQQLETIQTLSKQREQLVEQVNALKGRQSSSVDQEPIENTLSRQQAYFNEIINSNADCYIKNEGAYITEIQSLKTEIAHYQNLFRERQLAITNQSKEISNRNHQIERLKLEIEGLSIHQQSLLQPITQLQDIKDSTFKAKFLYLEKNQYFLRAEIERLVQENKILAKERDRASNESQNNSMALAMKAELKQLQQMFNSLQEQKQVALHNIRNENEGLAQRCKQREIQLIEQERLNTSLVNRFEDRERELIHKINTTDSVNRELSNHVESVTEQYHSLKNMINDKGRQEREESYGRSNLGGSHEVSLADKLKMLSFSDGNGNDKNDHSVNKSARKEKGWGETLNGNYGEPQPFSLAESNELVFEGDRPQSINVVSEQRYMLLFQENNSLKTKLEMVNLKIRDKEVEIMKLSENCISLQHQIQYLAGQLKQEKRQGNQNQQYVPESDFNKVASQNSFLRSRNHYLENQLKLDRNPSAKSFYVQGKEQGLASRLNSMLMNGRQSTQQDLLEISILKKISSEVGDLVESNHKLNERIHEMEKENQMLYTTINKISQDGAKDKAGGSAIQLLLKLNKMVFRILEWVDVQEILSEEENDFRELTSKLHHQIKRNDANKYLQTSQELLKIIISRIVNSRQDLFEQQAQQLIHLKQKLAELVNDQIDEINNYSEEQSSVVADSNQKLDEIGLLLRAYEKTKNPKLMSEVDRLLNKKHSSRKL